ncbi:MAG: NAD(P)H-dependent oxidoreductase [Bacilli bacterium]|nr:NAD(P)H-dependent oxidoreductase [Bacilli bacterium]
MNIVIIHGQSHKGSTYHIAEELAKRLDGEVTEFFLPRDFHDFCVGCTTCFIKGEEHCPHFASLKPITEALDKADVIVLASPVYVFHASGGMKNLLDHYGYRWMAHRPEKSMFTKQAVVISTAAGMGMKSTNKDMADSLFYWGVSRIYKCGFAVAATSFDGISQKKRKKIDAKLDSTARKIKKRVGRVKPTIKGRFMFVIMRMFQKSGWNPKDKEDWEKEGWLGKKRPWED